MIFIIIAIAIMKYVSPQREMYQKLEQKTYKVSRIIRLIEVKKTDGSDTIDCC